MSTLTITINTKDYLVGFEYKAAKFITEKFGYESYGDVQQELIDSGIDNIKLDLSFKQYHFLAKLVLFSIQSNPANKAKSLNLDTVEAYLFSHIDVSMDVINLYMDVTYKRMGKLQPNPKPETK